MLEFVARISDPVHGTVGLTKVEKDVVAAPAFQRLRNVKQLGLAGLVYPACDYSRFAHSVGACHVAGRVLSRLTPDDDVVQRYRLAALLHDCGHYPFSHAMERAVANHSTRTMVGVGSQPSPSPMTHERVGKELVRCDPDLTSALTRAGVEPAAITAIFTREAPVDQFANLISSDLDADRIDYLLRTAHHSGLPYGAVDIDYLLDHLRVDGRGRVCIDERAARTVDHFLLCRFFDYQQVTFHKTVVGLELVLESVLSRLLETGAVDCSEAALTEMIRSGAWVSFDDAAMSNEIRKVSADGGAPQEDRLRAKAVLLRNPPKALYQQDRFVPRNGARHALDKGRLAREKQARWAEKFNLPAERFYIWEKAAMFTKAGVAVPVSHLANVGDDVEQAVRVLSRGETESVPAAEREGSLMRILAEQALYTLRIYVLLDDGESDKRAGMCSQIATDLD